MLRCLGHGGGRLLARGDGSGGDRGRGRDAGAGRGVLVERLADAAAAGEQDEAGHDAASHRDGRRPPGAPAVAGGAPQAGRVGWPPPRPQPGWVRSTGPRGPLAGVQEGPGRSRRQSAPTPSPTATFTGLLAERCRLAYRCRLLSENESADFAGSAAGLQTTVPCGDSAARTRRRLGGELATDPVGLLGEDDLAALLAGGDRGCDPDEAPPTTRTWRGAQA
jgi:hypothetical protein